MKTQITENENHTGIIEAFVNLMDNIFHTGYTQELAKDDPERYSFELEQFLDNYHFETV